jgi:hypothetical protein
MMRRIDEDRREACGFESAGLCRQRVFASPQPVEEKDGGTDYCVAFFSSVTSSGTAVKRSATRP